MKNTFAIWSPFDVIEKGRDNVNGGDAEKMVGRIGGIISSEAKDQQNESLVQTGVDWSYFINKGWFNYEHNAGPDNVLGHPESVTPASLNGEPATRVEGVLYLHKPKAREIYETALAMKKAGGKRQLGFSVEGQVVERDTRNKTKITKARVLNVAITAHPVHPDARLEVLMRSLDKAGVGYQSPTGFQDAGSIGPLIPQSLEGVPALASFGVDAFRRKRMSVQELALLLTTTFPALNYAVALNVATEIARTVR